MASESAFVPAEILGVRATNDSPVVLLHDAERAIDRTLVIFIDYGQAQVIRAGLARARLPRPLTHDLLLAVLAHMGARVEKVVVEDMAQATFYASLYVRVGEELKRFDARPSDGLALAVRCGAQLEVSRKLMREAGVPDRDIRYVEEDDGGGDAVDPGEGSGEAAAGGAAKGGLVRVEVENVLMTSDGPRVFLVDPATPDDVLAIGVSPTQALNIQLALEGQLSPRPMTHDLFSQVLNELGAIVERVAIEALDGDTFYAGLYVQVEKDGATSVARFDARPSDGIALAVRVGAPIEVDAEVMRASSIPRDAIGMTATSADDDPGLGVAR